MEPISPLMVTDSDYSEKLEMYEHVFECPACGYEMVVIYSGYCPSCGKKLAWVLENKYDGDA